LIAFVLLRLAHDAARIVKSPLAFARLIRANLMDRRAITDLLQASPPPASEPHQTKFDFEPAATRAAQRSSAARACYAMEMAASSTNRAGQPWACPGHPRLVCCTKDVDARNKCGHDD